MSPFYPDTATSVADIPSGATIAAGGFGICGVPMELISAIHALGVDRQHVVSNNCGVG